ncbi:P-selectin isoform X2 [Brachyhypopomus gauderio]
MNWKTAFHWCRQHHTGMVAIQNKEEIAHLNQVLPFHKNYYWIGIRKVEGQWVWVATQKPLSAEAANWATDEPNDKGVGEDCVEIYIKRSKDTAMWNDAKCSLKKAALCYKASCFQSSCSKNAECVETIGNFTCLCASGFSGRLCEKAVDCGFFRHPDHSFVQCKHVYGEFKLNSSCQFHCSRGYRLQGSETLQCLASGQWSSDVPQCQIIQCPPMTNTPGGGSMNCSHPLNTDSYNSTCVFSCEEGFDLIGSNITQCDHTGQWTHQTPTCTAVTCDPIVTPEKGHMTCADPLGKFSFRSSCALSCEEGYTLRGEDTLACLKTGRWSAETPTCEAVMCGAPQSVPFGSLHCVDPVGEFRYGSSCWSECHIGFLLVGTNVTHCTSQGTWSDTLPVCQAVQCDPLSAASSGWIMNCSHPLNTDSYNSTCVFSCEEGFDLIGSNITQCDHTGQWTHQTPTCTAVMCGAPQSVPFGSLHCVDPVGEFRYGSSCWSECHVGFLLVGTNVTHCTSQGTWSDTLPVCQAVQCDPLSAASSGWIMNCSHPLNTDSYNSTCVFSCEEGFDLIGSNITQCDHTGQWTHQTPTCTAVMCGAPQSVPFGSLHCVDPVGEFRYGSSCWSECHVGFLLVGTNVTHCTSQGTLSDTLPVCQAVQCGPLSAASSGWIMNCSHPINTDSYNSTCVFSCEEGFDLIGSNITQCDHTGQWTYQTPTCTAVMCGALQSVPFGSLHCVNPVGEFRYGSSCWSECHIGFLLVGTNVTHCTSQGTWSDTLPVCQAVQCDPLSAASSGWIMNCSHPLNTDSYNSTCVFSCEEGFDLIGSNITQCDHTGQWTHQTPTCTAVMCGAPQSVPFGSLHCVDPVGEFRYGSSCWSECHVGFLLVGTNVTHCTSQGTWSDTLPVCQAVQCGPLSAASSGWIMYCSHPINTDSYNSTCVFSCEEGFELIGSNITQCDHTGQWTHQTPTCTAVQCEPLSSPDLPGVPSVPSMNCTHPRALFSFGSQCLLQCPEGYVLNGTSELNCTSSGLWTHTEAFPTCMVEETPLGTAMLVYVAAGMGSSLCLLIGAGLIVLLVQTFTKKAKFTPDTAAWEGSLNPAFEDI